MIRRFGSNLAFAAFLGAWGLIGCGGSTDTEPTEESDAGVDAKTDAKTDVSALVGEETIDQMALMLEKSGSLKSVGPPTGLP